MKYLLVISIFLLSLGCSNSNQKIIKSSSLGEPTLIITTETYYEGLQQNLGRNLNVIHIYVMPEVEYEDFIAEVTAMYETNTGIRAIHTSDPALADVIIDSQKYKKLSKLYRQEKYINIDRIIQNDLP